MGHPKSQDPSDPSICPALILNNRLFFSHNFGISPKSSTIRRPRQMAGQCLCQILQRWMESLPIGSLIFPGMWSWENLQGTKGNHYISINSCLCLCIHNMCICILYIMCVCKYTFLYDLYTYIIIHTLNRILRAEHMISHRLSQQSAQWRKNVLMGRAAIWWTAVLWEDVGGTHSHYVLRVPNFWRNQWFNLGPMLIDQDNI